MTDIESWKKREAELDRQIADFEKKFKHIRPCTEYKRTGYCIHLVNAQEKRFGNDTKALIGELVAISEKKNVIR